MPINPILETCRLRAFPQPNDVTERVDPIVWSLEVGVSQVSLEETRTIPVAELTDSKPRQARRLLLGERSDDCC